jgi:hypothetical protein
MYTPDRSQFDPLGLLTEFLQYANPGEEGWFT